MTSGSPAVVDDRVGGDARAARGRDDAGAPVAEGVTIGGHRDRRVEHQDVTADEIGHAGEVDVEIEDHRGGLRAVEDHFEADVNFHGESPVSGECCRTWLAVAVPKRVLAVLSGAGGTARSGGTRRVQGIDQHAPQRRPAPARGEHQALVDLQFDSDVVTRREAPTQVRGQPVSFAGIGVIAAYPKFRSSMPPAFPSSARTPRPPRADRGGRADPRRRRAPCRRAPG